MASLKELRQQKGLSQWELARLSGIHPSLVSRLERGELKLYPGWRKKIAQALGVKEEELECNSGK